MLRAAHKTEVPFTPQTRRPFPTLLERQSHLFLVCPSLSHGPRMSSLRGKRLRKHMTNVRSSRMSAKADQACGGCRDLQQVEKDGDEERDSDCIPRLGLF